MGQMQATTSNPDGMMSNRQETCPPEEEGERRRRMSGGTLVVAAPTSSIVVGASAVAASSANSIMTEEKIVQNSIVPTRLSSSDQSDHHEDSVVAISSSNSSNMDINNTPTSRRTDTKQTEGIRISPAVLKYYSHIHHHIESSSSSSPSKKHVDNNVSIETDGGGGTSQEEVLVDCISNEEKTNASSSSSSSAAAAVTSRTYNLRARQSPNNHMSSDFILQLPKSQQSRRHIMQEYSGGSGQAMITSHQEETTTTVNKNAAVTSSGIPHHDKRTRKIEKSSGLGAFKCKSCDRRYGRERDLKEHIVSHTTDACKCLVCFKSYSTVSGMLSHLQKMHYHVKFYNCHRCRVFTTLSQQDFRAHLMQVHKTKTRTSPRRGGASEKVRPVAKVALVLDKGRMEATVSAESSGTQKETESSSVHQQKMASGSNENSSQGLIENRNIILASPTTTEPINLSVERFIAAAAQDATTTGSALRSQTMINNSSIPEITIDDDSPTGGNSTSSSTTSHTVDLRNDELRRSNHYSERGPGHSNNVGIGSAKLHCSRCDRSFYMEQRLKSHSCFPKREVNQQQHMVEEEQFHAPSNQVTADPNPNFTSCSVSLSRLTPAEIINSNVLASSGAKHQDSVLEEIHNSSEDDHHVPPVTTLTPAAAATQLASTSVSIPEKPTTSTVRDQNPEEKPVQKPTVVTHESASKKNSKAVNNKNTGVRRRRPIVPKSAKCPGRNNKQFKSVQKKRLPPKHVSGHVVGQQQQHGQEGTCCVHENPTPSLHTYGSLMPAALFAPTTCDAFNSSEGANNVANNFFLIPPKMSSYIAQCIGTGMCMMLGDRISSSGCFCPGNLKPTACRPPMIGHNGMSHNNNAGPSHFMNVGAAASAVQENPAGGGGAAKRNNSCNFCQCFQQCRRHDAHHDDGDQD